MSTTQPTKERRHRCSTCRQLFPASEMVYGPDPYNEEIHNDSTKVWLCKADHRRSAEDI